MKRRIVINLDPTPFHKRFDVMIEADDDMNLREARTRQQVQDIVAAAINKALDSL